MESKDLRTEKGKKTRQEILAAAFALLIDEGPAALTAGKLAKKASVSKASLFHHFESVDDIPLILLKNIFEQLAEKIDKRKPKDISTLVQMLGQGVLDAPPARRKVTAALLHFYIRAAHEETYRQQQQKILGLLFEQFQASFEAVLDRPLTAWEKRTIPPMVAFSLEGIGLFSIILDDRSSLESAWKAFSGTIEQLFKQGRNK